MLSSVISFATLGDLRFAAFVKRKTRCAWPCLSSPTAAPFEAMNRQGAHSWQDKSDELMKHLIAALVSACLEVTITTCAWTYLSSTTAAPWRCTFTLDREAITRVSKA